MLKFRRKDVNLMFFKDIKVKHGIYVGIAPKGEQVIFNKFNRNNQGNSLTIGVPGRGSEFNMTTKFINTND
ncbi:hypothetical protein FDE76_15285 [Clostridium botulinum]|uniref:Uncharacterized protein n=3 Tax=Clostridium botulinum TaxID=1491 RepID=A0A0A0UT91_CLOBO|nr:hypothetical protein CLL_0054 [Clostridium botulinum B str. Eklund 17B (NRP)]AIW54483.1 hypothetical protein [Clostridium botulinum]AIW54537.1 hypothetical protein [Clostridium botulinum]MCR1275854.1 hypothetical protein [Clostridium botulinum]NFF34163.1 hypothetical protein [Clostridium botulinum]